MQQGPDQDLSENGGKLSFPDEVLLMIFNATGFPEPTFKLVCHHFNNVLEDNMIWKQSLYLHFPMLLEAAIKQPILNYKVKFKACFSDYQKYTDTPLIRARHGQIKKSLILAALRGDLGCINSEEFLKEHTKKFLYILAAAHGNNDAWQALEYMEKTSVLAHAVRIGYLSRFKILISNLEKESNQCEDNDYFFFLQTAIETNQTEIVFYLLENYSYSIEQINEAKTKVIKDDKILEKLENRFLELKIASPDFVPTTRISRIIHPVKNEQGEKSRKRHNSW